MSDSGTVRLAIEIDTTTNEQLKTFLPWGLKTEAIRALIALLIKTQRESAEYIVQDLIRGKCKLVVQSLNKSDEVTNEMTEAAFKALTECEQNPKVQELPAVPRKAVIVAAILQAAEKARV